MKALAVSASVQLLVLVGKTAALFNGTYDPTDELSGGMSLYAKGGNVGKLIEYCAVP